MKWARQTDNRSLFFVFLVLLLSGNLGLGGFWGRCRSSCSFFGFVLVFQTCCERNLLTWSCQISTGLATASYNPPMLSRKGSCERSRKCTRECPQSMDVPGLSTHTMAPTQVLTRVPTRSPLSGSLSFGVGLVRGSGRGVGRQETGGRVTV